jgi:hypothetical protein
MRLSMDDTVVWAAQALRGQRMPADEIGAVLETDDPQEIRRRLELHGERLQELLAEQLRTLSLVERLLTEALGAPPAAAERPELSPAGTR